MLQLTPLAEHKAMMQLKRSQKLAAKKRSVWQWKEVAFTRGTESPSKGETEQAGNREHLVPTRTFPPILYFWTHIL